MDFFMIGTSVMNELMIEYRAWYIFGFYLGWEILTSNNKTERIYQYTEDQANYESNQYPFFGCNCLGYS